MSRLTIDMTEQQHESLKASAALHGKTMKEYALEKLFSDQVDGVDALDELKALLGARIAEGLDGHIATISAADIVENALRRARHA
ncbi:MAG: antitoxin [Sphingobium limneticum]